MIANPDPEKSSIRVAAEEAIVVGAITGASAFGGLLATNVELTIRPFLIACLGALIAGITAYARKRRIEIKLGG